MKHVLMFSAVLLATTAVLAGAPQARKDQPSPYQPAVLGPSYPAPKPMACHNRACPTPEDLCGIPTQGRDCQATETGCVEVPC